MVYEMNNEVAQKTGHTLHIILCKV